MSADTVNTDGDKCIKTTDLKNNAANNVENMIILLNAYSGVNALIKNRPRLMRLIIFKVAKNDVMKIMIVKA